VKMPAGICVTEQLQTDHGVFDKQSCWEGGGRRTSPANRKPGVSESPQHGQDLVSYSLDPSLIVDLFPISQRANMIPVG